MVYSESDVVTILSLATLSPQKPHWFWVLDVHLLKL